MSSPNIAFFGGEPLGVAVLEKLHEAGIKPNLIICSPDRPAGRGQKLTPPPVKLWAETAGIEIFQPASYRDLTQLKPLTEQSWDLFVVVAYNFILPKWLIELPKKGTLNVHPSLLPKLRGPSPIRTAILEDRKEEIGVSIMLLDEEMDHGPILAQSPFEVKNWPVSGPDLDDALANLGGELLAATIPTWLNESITPVDQDHTAATYTQKFKKPDNELVIDPQNLPTGQIARSLLNKINAWTGIGDTYFIHNGLRVKVKAADLTTDGQLNLISVVPEGKKEMSFVSYLQSL